VIAEFNGKRDVVVLRTGATARFLFGGRVLVRLSMPKPVRRLVNAVPLRDPASTADPVAGMQHDPVARS
jgi:hypothetical protein